MVAQMAEHLVACLVEPSVDSTAEMLAFEWAASWAQMSVEKMAEWTVHAMVAHWVV